MNQHDEREWQAQERAMHNERLGVDASDDDALVARYRTIARALRQPPPGALPSNFAYAVAQQAAARARAADADSSVERWLVRGLVALMTLAAIAVIGAHGEQWWRATAALFAAGGVGAGGWIIALGACLAMTFGLGGLRSYRDTH
ncbi:MAG: hypothetical protein ABJA62_02200 [Luteimonas sp.]